MPELRRHRSALPNQNKLAYGHRYSSIIKKHRSSFVIIRILFRFSITSSRWCITFTSTTQWCLEHQNPHVDSGPGRFKVDESNLLTTDTTRLRILSLYHLPLHYAL